MQINLDPRTLPEARLELTRVSQEVTVLEGRIAALPKVEESPAFLELRGQLATAQTSLATAQADLATARVSLSTKDGELTKVQGDLTKAQGDVSDFDKKLAAAANDKAIEIVAAKGLGPMKLGLEENKKGAKSEARGRDRVAAIWNEQLSATK